MRNPLYLNVTNNQFACILPQGNQTLNKIQAAVQRSMLQEQSLPVTQREKSTSGSGLLFPKAFLDTG
jgi:hypothetical protein